MSCKSFPTLDEALTALDETSCNEDENIDLAIAPSDVAVISDEEATDEGGLRRFTRRSRRN